MYCDFFGLRCRPFEDRADARFYCATAESDEILSAMAVESGHGQQARLVLGEAGTGKTLLIRALLQRLHATDHAVVITWSASGEMSLIRETCKRFGVTLPDAHNEDRCLARLRRHLKRIGEADHRCILIVDQAENLTAANFAELNQLIDIQDNEPRLLRVILVAQPRFREALAQPALDGLRQRLCGERTIAALSSTETAAYIAHRLRVAGAGDAELFEPGAIEIIHTATGGIARLINRVADAALHAAFGAGEQRVTRHAAASAQRRIAGIGSKIGEDLEIDHAAGQTTTAFADTETLERRLVESILATCQTSIEQQVEAQMHAHRHAIEAEIAKYRARIGALIETSTANVPAIRQIQELIANALQVNEALHGTVAHADSKIGQLNSHHAAAASVLRRLSEATVIGQERAEDLTGAVSRAEDTIKSGQQIVNDVWETTSRTETNMRALTATNKKAIELIGNLGDVTETAEPTIKQLDERTAEAGRCLEGMTSGVKAADEIVERLGAVQGLCDEIKDAETSINATTEQAKEICQQLAEATRSAISYAKSLSEINAEAYRLIEGNERLKQDADASIERLATQVSTAQRVIDKGSPMLQELIARSRGIHDQLDGLRRRADEIERVVDIATTRPNEIVAAAQEQAAQLEGVVAAVGKVFGILSKTSLDAQHRVSEFRRTSDDAQQKLSQLTDDTARAASTLREWVEEAVRIQARMERTLQTAPSIGDTHSGEVLRQMSRSVGAVGRIGSPGTSGELAVLKDRRADEVTQIIENARKSGAES